MNVVENDVRNLVIKELKEAQKDYGRYFVSEHEGESVIREEVNEVVLETEHMKDIMDSLTHAVYMRYSRSELNEIVAHLYSIARRNICEAIQVAAMCRKFTVSEFLSTEEREKIYNDISNSNNDVSENQELVGSTFSIDYKSKEINK